MHGIFNDEGLIEGDFPTKTAAALAIVERYSPDDDLMVEELCPDHPEQPRFGCEECDEDEEEEEEE